MSLDEMRRIGLPREISVTTRALQPPTQRFPPFVYFKLLFLIYFSHSLSVIPVRHHHHRETPDTGRQASMRGGIATSSDLERPFHSSENCLLHRKTDQAFKSDGPIITSQLLTD